MIKIRGNTAFQVITGDTFEKAVQINCLDTISKVVFSIPSLGITRELDLMNDVFYLRFEANETKNFELGTYLYNLTLHLKTNGVKTVVYNQTIEVINVFSDTTEREKCNYDNYEILEQYNDFDNQIDLTIDLLDVIRVMTPKVLTSSYEEVLQLIAQEKLEIGTYYRLIDYETLIDDERFSTAGHLFDVVLLAATHKSFFEDAWVCPSERDIDGYFAHSNLLAWKIRYSIHNDIERFGPHRASLNGKGVIYWLKDEFGNEAPYDFKNIKHSDEYLFEGDGDASLTGQARDCVIKADLPLSTIYCAVGAYDIFIGSNCENISVLYGYNITIENDCSNITVSGSFITIGKGSLEIHGEHMESIRVGPQCVSVHLASVEDTGYLKDVIVGPGVSYVLLKGSTVGSPDSILKNVVISEGVSGTSDSLKVLTALRNASYSQHFRNADNIIYYV